jgi:hypothetical protein
VRRGDEGTCLGSSALYSVVIFYIKYEGCEKWPKVPLCSSSVGFFAHASVHMESLLAQRLCNLPANARAYSSHHHTTLSRCHPCTRVLTNHTPHKNQAEHLRISLRTHRSYYTREQNNSCKTPAYFLQTSFQHANFLQNFLQTVYSKDDFLVDAALAHMCHNCEGPINYYTLSIDILSAHGGRGNLYTQCNTVYGAFVPSLALFCCATHHFLTSSLSTCPTGMETFIGYYVLPHCAKRSPLNRMS